MKPLLLDSKQVYTLIKSVDHTVDSIEHAWLLIAGSEKESVDQLAKLAELADLRDILVVAYAGRQ